MANRFPLIVNSSVNAIQELAAGDNLDLTSSGISNVGDINSVGFSTLNAVSASALRVTGVSTVGVVTGATSIQATVFYGSGSGLTGVASTDNIQTGTDARFLSNISVSGISTLSGGVLASQGLDAARLRVTGISTHGQTTTVGLSNAGISTLGNATASTLVVSGVSTVGVVTGATSIQATVFYGSGAGLTGVASTDNIQTGTPARFLSNINVSGFSTLGATSASLLNVSGVSTFSSDVTIGGNLTVNGTTTTINSTTITVDDKNIELASTASPSDAAADGGGITLKGTTDKTFNWVNATAAWTSSEDLNLLTGKQYEINGASVLTSTTLGSGVVNSSLTSVGTLTGLTVSGGVNGSQGADLARLRVTGISTLATTSVGDVTSASTLNVTGFSTISGGLSVPLITSSGIATFLGTIEIGNATDTTLSRASAGRLAIEGVNIVTVSSSDTLTNKTLTSPVLNTPTINSPTITDIVSASTLRVTGFTTLSGGTSNALLSVSGVSTFSGGVLASQGIDASGLRVTGITTLGQVATVGLSNSGISTLGNATASTSVVSGFSTLGATSATLLRVTGISTVGVVTGATSVQATNFYGDGSGLTGIANTANISATTLAVSGISTFGGINELNTSTTTVATTTATSIIGIATATFRSAKIQVQIAQGSSYQASDILLIHDGVTSNIIEYGSLATGSLLGSYSTDINSGNARLLVTMSSATSATVRVVANKIII